MAKSAVFTGHLLNASEASAGADRGSCQVSLMTESGGSAGAGQLFFVLKVLLVLKLGCFPSAFCPFHCILALVLSTLPLTFFLMPVGLRTSSNKE